MTALLKQNKLTHINKTHTWINFLKDSKFSEDLMFTGSEFQIFGVRFLKLLVPYLTWFVLGVTRFILQFCLTGILFETECSKISFI